MHLGLKYKLIPNKKQAEKILVWLVMLRMHYNWCLRDRIDSYSQRFNYGTYCDIKTQVEITPLCCPLGGATGYPWKISGKRKAKKEEEQCIFGDYCDLETKKLRQKTIVKQALRDPGEIQMAELPVLKLARPWYDEIDSTVLQENVKRLDKAYQSFFDRNCVGFPKFKNRSNFRSFTYTTGVQVSGNKIYLPKIGWVKFHNSRTIPPGFKITSATVRALVDGFYVTLKVEDKTVPTYPIMPAESVKTAVGCDMGINKLVSLSDGSQIKNPKFATNKKTKHLMKIRQRRVSRKKKGSNNRAKAGIKVAKMHRQIADRRNAYLWLIARKICLRADAIFLEDLKVSNMKKRCKPKKDPETGRYLNNGQSKKAGLNRAISDAAWYDLRQKIEYTAAKLGKICDVVPPQYTSQECPKCHHVDSSNRDGEKFVCSECGYSADADLNAAVNIKILGVTKLEISLSCRVKIKKVRQDLSEPKQLALFETPTDESPSGKRRNARSRKRNDEQPGNPPEQLCLFDWDNEDKTA